VGDQVDYLFTRKLHGYQSRKGKRNSEATVPTRILGKKRDQVSGYTAEGGEKKKGGQMAGSLGNRRIAIKSPETTAGPQRGGGTEPKKPRRG